MEINEKMSVEEYVVSIRSTVRRLNLLTRKAADKYDIEVELSEIPIMCLTESTTAPQFDVNIKRKL